jgi:methylmalonyl-CoA mutase N-terminal domain/subunit
MAMRFHVQTGGSTLTAQQPDVNVVRTTVQALAAVLGGTQSLHTNALDEALGLPTPATARLALRTQQVLYEESGVAATVDPLAGSWYVESLTDEIARRALDEIARIDDRGGTLAALADGYQQDAIGDAAYEVQRAIESGERAVVGLNAFTVGVEGDEQRPAPQTIDPELEARQVARTRALRERRDAGAAREALAALEAAAAGTENVLPRIRACVEANVTLGEIAGALRRTWGEHRP